MMDTTISIMKQILILIFCCLGFVLGCTENKKSQSSEPNRDATKNEQNPLMGFKATGNSPHWQLEVGFNATLSFGTENARSFTITEADSLSIDPLPAKRADCPNGETETAFLEDISNKHFRFAIKNLRLRFISNETVLVFKKVD